jgi:hypothetical protein
VFFFCFFVFFNLWWSQIGDHHPQEELAKFGYMSKRKVEKNKNPAIFWWPAGRNLLSKYGDFQKSLPWDLATSMHSFSQKSFCMSLHWNFFGSPNMVKICHQKKRNTTMYYYLYPKFWHQQIWRNLGFDSLIKSKNSWISLKVLWNPKP